MRRLPYSPLGIRGAQPDSYVESERLVLFWLWGTLLKLFPVETARWSESCTDTSPGLADDFHKPKLFKKFHFPNNLVEGRLRFVGRSVPKNNVVKWFLHIERIERFKDPLSNNFWCPLFHRRCLLLGAISQYIRRIVKEAKRKDPASFLDPLTLEGTERRGQYWKDCLHVP